MDKNKTEKLPRDSWDFSLCPEEELSLCLTHEYFRQIAMVHRNRVGNKWSTQVFEELFDGYFKDGKRIKFKDIPDPYEINLSIKVKFALAACKCSGFPDTPYLRLHAMERSAWVKELGLNKLRPDRPAMAQEDLFEIIRDPKEALRFYQCHLQEWFLQNLSPDPKSATGTSPLVVAYDGFHLELGVVRINWSLSDKKLVEAFEKWVEKSRPCDVKALETRGSTKMSEMLKYLSAMRLLSVMTASEAADFTQQKLNEPLYWDDISWYKARTKAEAVMKQISMPFFDWA
jgi:hypothetical protein